MSHHHPGAAGDALLADARSRVRQLLPGAFETTDEMSGMITYSYGGDVSDLACMVARRDEHVLIGFYNAEELPDPAGMLRRRGVRHRYVAVRSARELHAAAIDELLAAVRQRHGDQRRVRTGEAHRRDAVPATPGRPDQPAAETLICLLIGLVIGALLAESLQSRTTGLVVGLLFAVTWLWIRSRRRGSEG